jgi:hypothetical protein
VPLRLEEDQKEEPPLQPQKHIKSKKQRLP